MNSPHSRCRSAAALLALALAFAAPARAESVGAVDVWEYDLGTVRDLGIEIALADGYAAAASEIVLLEVPDLEKYPVQGYVLSSDEQGTLVTFYGPLDGDLKGIFEVRPDAPLGEQFQGVIGKPLGAEQRARIEARRTALVGVDRPCSERYDTVALRDPAGDGWLVYALAASPAPGVIMAGGHYRFAIAEDGVSVRRAERLSTDCLTMDITAEQTARGARPDTMLVAHREGTQPLETHVYLSLLHDIDIAVATREAGIWRVSGPEITLMADIETAPSH